MRERQAKDEVIEGTLRIIDADKPQRIRSLPGRPLEPVHPAWPISILVVLGLLGLCLSIWACP